MLSPVQSQAPATTRVGQEGGIEKGKGERGLITSSVAFSVDFLFYFIYYSVLFMVSFILKVSFRPKGVGYT